MIRAAILAAILVALILVTASAPATGALPMATDLDVEVSRAMKATGAKGLALAIIDAGALRYVQAFGVRDAKGDALTPNTLMYGASLTKTVFAYAVMQLVDRGKLNLDQPIASMLRKPLVDFPANENYPKWADLAGDDRWRLITPRHALTHSTGLPNYASLEDDGRLHIHFTPGTRYAYSGAGIALLQFGLEKGALLSVRDLTDAVFKQLGMTRTHLRWNEAFADNVADGWRDNGDAEPHVKQDEARAASSMDTTIIDMSKFVAAQVTCKGLSVASCAQMTQGQLHISSRRQFPTLRSDLQLPSRLQRKDLYSGLGVIVFDGPQGRGFYKGGHDSSTGNMLVCLERPQRCVVILSNDVRAEKAFPRLVKFILGEAGVPFDWEYGDQAGKS